MNYLDYIDIRYFILTRILNMILDKFVRNETSKIIACHYKKVVLFIVNLLPRDIDVSNYFYTIIENSS